VIQLPAFITSLGAQSSAGLFFIHLKLCTNSYFTTTKAASPVRSQPSASGLTKSPRDAYQTKTKEDKPSIQSLQRGAKGTTNLDSAEKK
jgi:hypothetical protein